VRWRFRRADKIGRKKTIILGLVLATVFAGFLFAGLLLNWIYNPAKEHLAKLDSSEYRVTGSFEPQNIK
jgi:MFS family permease